MATGIVDGLGNLGGIVHHICIQVVSNRRQIATQILLSLGYLYLRETSSDEGVSAWFYHRQNPQLQIQLWEPYATSENLRSRIIFAGNESHLAIQAEEPKVVAEAITKMAIEVVDPDFKLVPESVIEPWGDNKYVVHLHWVFCFPIAIVPFDK